jgi:uncharacterized protein with HEPN domain
MSKNRLYLKRIKDTIADVEGFTNGLAEKEFLQNKEMQYAVQLAIEMIGEATKNLTADLKMGNTQVQWKKFADIQDDLVQMYFQVDLELVWNFAQENLPELKQAIVEILET